MAGVTRLPQATGVRLTSIDPLQQDPPDDILIDALNGQGRAAHSKNIPFELRQLLEWRWVRGWAGGVGTWQVLAPAMTLV